MIGDITAMVLAFGLALLIGHNPPVRFSLFWHYRWGLVTLLSLGVTLSVVLDAYSLHRLPNRFMYQSALLAIGLSVSAVLATFIFFFSRAAVPRAVLLLYLILSWSFITVFRYFYSRHTLSRIYWRVLLVGGHASCTEISHLISSKPYLRAEVVGYVADELEDGLCGRSPLLGPLSVLNRVVDQRSVDQVIVTSRKVSDDLMKDLLVCMRRKVVLADSKQVIETIAGKIPLEYIDDTWLIENIAAKNKRWFWFIKRLMDIAISLIGLCLALPLLPFIALMIAADTPGPVFYSQTRLGRGGKHFTLWKFRTMVQDADRNNVHWTNHDDERITSAGRILRKVHLDELPQLYNILKGEMSLIGPRPEAVSLVELYQKEIPYYSERHMVTPGITGWAQINHPYGNSIDDAREKLKYDFYYIKNRNFVLDAIILLRTIRIVVTGKGAL
jgi:exopolysaccharide biosynthesis polyprenyl glycosylphosphotransferase